MGSTVVCPFLSMQEKGNAACGLLIKCKFVLQKLVSWTANGPIRMPQGYILLGVTHFWGPLWVPLSLHAGKGKCCMWPVNKVEIHFAKIGFVDCKWSNSNAPGSYTPWCHSLLGPLWGVPFLCMQEKGNAACGVLIKWKFTFEK